LNLRVHLTPTVSAHTDQARLIFGSSELGPAQVRLKAA
jgi:hypothetical protein